MSKTLVLAEKPSVAREIARVLGCKKNGNGCLIGDNYIITWALGHLVTLSDPEHYGSQYQKWELETLPMLPSKMDLDVIPQTAKQYKAVKALLHDKEVSSLVIATDAGREGELVARWIIAKAGFSKPIRRLWISSQTDKAIREGFQHLKNGKEYYNLYQSAQARAEADWLVGLNVTRALTCKYNAQLSAGRVQTPTLAVIVQREEEIKRFQAKEYYRIQCDLGKFFVSWHDSKNQTAIFDQEKAQAMVHQFKNKSFRIISVKKSQKKIGVPMLYDLTELQRDANKKFGFSAKQTLSIMQNLYERHKLLTYPRTDSRYLTGDIVPTLKDRLKAVSIGEFSQFAKEITTRNLSIAKACINNSKVSDHHAIIPTEERGDLSRLASEEKKIYALVVKRFLACFYPPCEQETLSVELSCENEAFCASGTAITAPGWKKVYEGVFEDDDEDASMEKDPEQTLPFLKNGMEFISQGCYLKTGKTKPPARYTEATLLSAMENPSRFVQDKKMKEHLGGGLGTPATRADIIEKLFSAFYIERHGKEIVPTSKGCQVVKLAPVDLTNPLLTAKWEMQLDSIAKGNSDKNVFIKDIKTYASKLVSSVIASDVTYIHDNMTKKPCPECGKMLLSVNGKKGKMLVCQDRVCGYRETVSLLTNARCPNCHKKMEMLKKGDKKSFVCVCGYRENEDAFIKRTRGNKNSASKSYTQQYLRNQNKRQEEEESDFARALRLSMEKGKK